MKKRSYRAQKVNEVGWEEMADRVKNNVVVWAIDVAKVEQYGVLMNREREVVVTVKWAHPAETPALLEQVRGLPCASLTAVMESTGVYGDTLRRQLREAGLEVHLMSAKRVHDACEVYERRSELARCEGGAGDWAAVLRRGESGVGGSERASA